MLVASVFVNIPVKSIAKAFTYSVPAELPSVGVGWRVFVPFGGRRVEGFVLAVRDMGEDEIAEQKYALKDIIAAVDEEAWFSPRMIEIATWLADFYLCSLAEMMRLFMPGKSGLKIAVEYAADAAQAEHILLGMPIYRAIYDYLRENGARSRAEIARALPETREELAGALEKMASYRIVTKEYAAEKRDKAQWEKSVVLRTALTDELRESLRRKKAQLHAVEILAAAEGNTLTAQALREQKVSTATLKALTEAGIVEITSRRVLRDSYSELASARREVELTAEQQAALTALEAARVAGEYHGFLLHGVTGSGKTQVYIELARRVRATGREVVVLVPEIALTGQVVMAFKAYFGTDIVVIHSRLSLAERNDAMLRVRRREAGVIIGARSALFTPALDIGLVIMDEEQDMSYKQDESPRYHARVVAEQIARVHGAVLLLGSATPSLESYARAQVGQLTHLVMEHRIGDLPLPMVKCVDMREELHCGNRHIMSRELQQLVEQTIARGEQVIIMLNRRGFSTFVMCRECGEVIKCHECGLPMVYHRSGRLACHHCDIVAPTPDICPKCGSRYIKYFGSGTEKLEDELKALVPQARVVRMDRDTTTRKFAHQEIIAAFRRHEYDILLGTQMVAKGHDIPSVTAVGIISADSSLNMPDFRAAERCFMLITQTAGRAGRHTGEGHVVIQTYSPTHYAVQTGIAQDYASFAREELVNRHALFYPPYSRLVKLLFQHEDEAQARANAAALIEKFKAAFAEDKKQQIIGPAPAVIACLRGIYRFVVLIKTANLKKAQDFLHAEGLHLDTNVAIDIDPITML